MKRAKITYCLLLAGILGIPFGSFSQYTPTLNENSEWYSYSWFEVSYNETFQITGDSIVNDTIYKKLASFPTGSTPSFYETSLVREDIASKRIYRRANGLDFLMYDFSLQTGDTFKIKRPDGGYLHHLVLDSISDTLYNTTVNFLQTNIGNRKVYYFHDTEYAFIDNVVWIEGIGSLAGLLYSDESWNGGHTGQTLLCHYNEQGNRDFHYIYYEEPNPCESIVSVDNLGTEKKVKISPNPSTDGIFSIEGKGIRAIEIYNASGSLLNTLDISITDMGKINLSKYPKGIYFIRVLFRNQTSSVSKVVKI